MNKALSCPVAALVGWGLSALLHGTVQAQSPLPPSPQALQATVTAEVQPLLATLKTLVQIESGSRDLEGLATLSALISQHLKDAGMAVQTLPTRAPDFHPRLKGATLGSMVYATRTGTGQRKLLLIAHMDTVYAKGQSAKQPFRIDGERAYGLGIADDEGGVALILHAVKLLQRVGFDDYAQLGVLINADEEIGSAGSSAFIAERGSEYDAVLSFEGGGFELNFTRGRPALAATAASRALAAQARSIYAEVGLTLDVRERATGGGTDAAYAALRPKGGVLEGFGLRGFGAHSNDDEFILVSSIAPRLYLATRMVMEAGSGAVRW